MENQDRDGGLSWAVILSGCALLVATAGCCCGLKRRAPFDKDVVAARELARRGQDALLRDSLPEAHGYFARALKTCPDDTDARFHLAKVLWQQGQAEQAIEEMDAAVRGSGGDPVWRVELGKMLLAQEEHEGALESAARALERSPELAAAWRLQAGALQATGQSEPALQAYHRALSCGDQSAFVLMQIAELYRDQGRPRRALSTLQRLEDELPAEEHPQQLAFLQGLACSALDRHEDAVDHLTVARQQLGDQPKILFHLAAAQFSAGQPKQARETARLVRPSEQLSGEHRAQLAAYLGEERPEQVARAVHTQ